MDKKKFEEFLGNAKIGKYAWTKLDEIDSIILSNGKGIYPNWKHLRFYITDTEIFIQHGDSFPYGGRLCPVCSYSFDYMSVSFSTNRYIAPSSYYTDLPHPKTGDRLVSGDGKKILSESIILSTEYYGNQIVVNVATPITATPYSKLSFYDPRKYDSVLCCHGDIAEGIYMKFKANPCKRPKKFGAVHESIKIKEIQEINLSLKCNKTFKIQ